MKVNQLFPSNYLRATDLDGDTVVTIQRITPQDFNGEPKHVLLLRESKGLVLNKTNAETIGATHGQHIEAWTGKEIELFSQMVPFQGQNVAAIRVRAATEAVAAIPPQPTQDADLNDPVGI